MINKNEALCVVWAEDDDEDWLLVSDVLEEECKGAINYERVKDGEALLERLRDKTKPLPHLIMLDLKMPRMDGAEALQAIKSDEELKQIPITILTTSSLESDIFKAYHKGANSYLVKPIRFPEMAKALKEVHRYWTQVASIPDPLMARSVA